jgi:predicted dehydrogenase
MRALKIGVLGCASVAERLVIPAIAQSTSYDLVAVASRDRHKAERFAKTFDCAAEYSYEQLLARPDVDVVYSPLPCGLQPLWISEALKHGKHVLAEKSLAPSLKDVIALCSQAASQGLLIDENFMFCHHKQIGIAKSLISEYLGDLRVLRASFGFPPLDEDNIRYTSSLGGGSLLDAGAYTLKAASLFMGTEIQILSSKLNYCTRRRVDTSGSAMAANQAGSIAMLSFGFENFYQCEVQLWGSEGKITLDRAFTAGPTFAPKILIETQSEKRELNVGFDNHFVNKLENFARVIRDGKFQPTYDELIQQATLIDRVK